MNELGDMKRPPIAYILCGQLDQDQEDRFDPSARDLTAEATSIRQEANDRLLIQSNELKRFHNKSCFRVTSRERDDRLQVQRAQKHLHAKCAKVFASTDLSQQTNERVKVQVSARPALQRIRDDKRKHLKGCPLENHMEKILRFETHYRDDLLQSIVSPRSLQSNSDEQDRDKVFSDSMQFHASPTLLPEQRVVLYGVVRRQYMKMNRASVQKTHWQRNNSTFDTRATRSKVARAATGQANNKCKDLNGASSSAKVINLTFGGDVRVQREIAISSTPWRKMTGKKLQKPQLASRAHERFLQPFQVKTPSQSS